MDIANISSLIKNLRIKSGLSQNEVAQKVPVSPSTLQNWEAGRQVPPADKFILLIQILGDQNSLTNFDLGHNIFKGSNNNQVGQVNGGVGIGGTPNTLNLKYRDDYVKLEQLAVMGGTEGEEALIKGLEKLKDELK